MKARSRQIINLGEKFWFEIPIQTEFTSAFVLALQYLLFKSGFYFLSF